MATNEDIPVTDAAQIERLIERVRTGSLTPEELTLIERILHTLLSLMALIQGRHVTLRKLRELLFGGKRKQKAAGKDTKTPPPAAPGAHIGGAAASAPGSTPGAPETTAPESKDTTEETSARRNGHGQRPLSDYPGAVRMPVAHPTLAAGDPCPHPGCGGRVYEKKKRNAILRLFGSLPVIGRIYQPQKFRCSSCQDIFNAPLPPEAGAKKFDETADVAIVCAKYNAGVPLTRLKHMEAAGGIFLSEATQFERIEQVANCALPVFLRLLRLAQCGTRYEIDDTGAKILACLKEDEEEKGRATKTTGIIVTCSEYLIALLVTKRQHAGENLDEVLADRPPGLPVPVKMSDALSHNHDMKSPTLWAKCLAHPQREFRELAESFPLQSLIVQQAIRQLFDHEAETAGMSAAERLAYHQEKSGPVVEELYAWVARQFADGLVEPNSEMGKALRYLETHRDGLTLFLREAGVPLDNNRCERLLKRFVLLRKNSLFYKTEYGAYIGSLLLSLLETCRLNGVNAWEYLVAVCRNAQAVRRNPELWLPWNYPRAAPA
jgi:hypothetical protein